MTSQTVWINRSAEPSLEFLAESPVASVLVVGGDRALAGRVAWHLPYADVRWVDVETAGDARLPELVVRVFDPTPAVRPWRARPGGASMGAFVFALGLLGMSGDGDRPAARVQTAGSHP